MIKLIAKIISGWIKLSVTVGGWTKLKLEDIGIFLVETQKLCLKFVRIIYEEFLAVLQGESRFF